MFGHFYKQDMMLYFMCLENHYIPCTSHKLNTVLYQYVWIWDHRHVILPVYNYSALDLSEI